MPKKIKQDQIDVGGKKLQVAHFSAIGADEHGFQIESDDDTVFAHVAFKRDTGTGEFQVRITNPSESGGLVITGDDAGNTSFDLKSEIASTISSLISIALDAPVVNMSDNILSRPELQDYSESTFDHGSMGATETINVENGNFHYGTLDSDCTFTFTNPSPTSKACSFTLELTQDGTGGWVPTWPASVKIPIGGLPSVSTDPGAVVVYIFYTRDAGTTWRIMLGSDYSS